MVTIQFSTWVVVVTFTVIISFMSYDLDLQVASCIKMWVDLQIHELVHRLCGLVLQIHELNFISLQ